MRTGKCRCGNRIYFNNVKCLACEAILGHCDCCSSLTSFVPTERRLKCDACDRHVDACPNQIHKVCNSFVPRASLCRWCAFTTDIPDLSDSTNVARWARLELAKRMLLRQLNDLQLPPFKNDLNTTHPLTFRFLGDMVDESGNHQKTVTGHANGVVTINIAEADSVQRERTRIELGEPQRTLIGHMRHEVGHYIDWSFASRVAAERYCELFGDPESVDYSRAMDRHYETGPPHDWADHFVSEYASMHPWEDFAETINVYLDIMAIATTANDQRRATFDLAPSADPVGLLQDVLRIVVEVSEYNFDLGLQPLLPERFPKRVMDKLAYVHSLRLDQG